MPAFLEQKLKARYGANSAIPYKIMSKLGLIRGQRETPRGRAMQAKHERDQGRSAAVAGAAGRAGQHPRGRLRALMDGY